VQADFGILRNLASLPYTMGMIGFAFGGVAMGRLADRFGIVFPAILGTVLLAAGYLAAGFAPNIWVLAAAYTLTGVGNVRHLRPHRRRHVALVRQAARHRDRDRRRAATMRRARSGHRSCSISSPRTAGARPTSVSGSSAWSRWCRSR